MGGLFSMLMLLAKKKRRRRKQKKKNLPTQKGKESVIPPTSSSSSYNRCHKTLPHICLFPPQLTGSKMKRLHVCCSICFSSLFSFFYICCCPVFRIWIPAVSWFFFPLFIRLFYYLCLILFLIMFSRLPRRTIKVFEAEEPPPPLVGRACL